MATKKNILHLDIDGKEVEKIAYFGPHDIQRKVDEFKNVYNLTNYSNYEFYIMKESKMNRKTKEDLL